MQNKMQYINPVRNDPFFKATTRGSGTGFAPLFFQADQSVAMLGCIEQYQLCNGNLCTPMDALNRTNHASLTAIGYNSRQMAVYDNWFYMMFAGRLFNMVYLLQDDILLAKQWAFGSYEVSPGLPDNHWQSELANIFNISLAVAQRVPLEHAHPANLSLSLNQTYLDYLLRENTTEAINLCNNQKVKAAGYVSYNILGLTLILVSATIAIVLGNFVPNIARSWHRRWPLGGSQTRTDQWAMDDVLQLQKIALEGYGISGWQNVYNVPTSIEASGQVKTPWFRRPSRDIWFGTIETDKASQYRLSLKLNVPEITFDFRKSWYKN
jgi:hypothetical protein